MWTALQYLVWEKGCKLIKRSHEMRDVAIESSEEARELRREADAVLGFPQEELLFLHGGAAFRVPATDRMFVLSLAAIFVLGPAMATYDLGSEMAMALGEPVGRSRPWILLTAVVLSSAAVTAVGPLVFLGVLAPHIAGFLSPAVARARLDHDGRPLCCKRIH